MCKGIGRVDVPFKWAKFLGSVPDCDQECIVQRAHKLVDSVIIWRSFHVCRKLSGEI